MVLALPHRRRLSNDGLKLPLLAGQEHRGQKPQADRDRNWIGRLLCEHSNALTTKLRLVPIRTLKNLGRLDAQSLADASQLRQVEDGLTGLPSGVRRLRQSHRRGELTLLHADLLTALGQESSDQRRVRDRRRLSWT